jgi:protein associated with RNAse G/E
MQIGRQIISSLIREQITRHEYENLKKQIEQSREVDRFLRENFTNAELHAWMQGESSKLYHEYYKFAFDIARKAKQTMKHELMRREMDATDYVKFN